MATVLDPLTDASEVTPGRLYFIPIKRIASLRHSPLARAGHCFCVDEELVYQPFFADFGPLNLGQSYRYCELLRHILKDTAAEGKKVFHITSADPHKLANAAVLMGLYMVICEKMSAEDAYRPLAKYGPYVPFRDPSCGVSTHHLSVLDCLKGMERAVKENFIDFDNFDIDYYEHYEQVENGDLNWMLKGKLIAFSGPSAKRTEFHGYRSLVPEDYIQVFKKAGVTAVVRLNKKMYDKRRFTDHGIRHYDLFFPDGSCPSESILLKFMEIAEAEPGAVAVHCKAGLGRTGVLIGGYLMKHFNFTAEEVIGYLRILRPGSIIGPQQHYMKEVQELLYREGAEFRRRGGRRSFDVEAAAALGGDSSPLDDGGGEEERVANASPMKPLRSGTRPTVIPSGEGRQPVDEKKPGRATGANLGPPTTPQGPTRSKSTTRASSYSSSTSTGGAAGTPGTPGTPLTPSTPTPATPFQSRLRSGSRESVRDNRLTRSATSTAGSPLTVATARFKLANQGQASDARSLSRSDNNLPLADVQAQLRQGHPGADASSSGRGSDTASTNSTVTTAWATFSASVGQGEADSAPPSLTATSMTVAHVVATSSGRASVSPMRTRRAGTAPSVSTGSLNGNGSGSSVRSLMPLTPPAAGPKLLGNITGGAPPPSPTSAKGVVIQRVINSAGQPRKVATALGTGQPLTINSAPLSIKGVNSPNSPFMGQSPFATAPGGSRSPFAARSPGAASTAAYQRTVNRLQSSK